MPKKNKMFFFLIMKHLPKFNGWVQVAEFTFASTHYRNSWIMVKFPQAAKLSFKSVTLLGGKSL